MSGLVAGRANGRRGSARRKERGILVFVREAGDFPVIKAGGHIGAGGLQTCQEGFVENFGPVAEVSEESPCRHPLQEAGLSHHGGRHSR